MGRVRALVSLAAATLHQQQRHPWAVAFRTAFASEVAALRSTDGRAAFARTCAPVVLIAGGLCICRPLQEWLRGADGQSFLDLLWMETPGALASAMATAWLVTAPCVSLLHPTRPAGSSDLSVCHAQLAARVALLQSPALLFTIPAVALNPLRLSLLARMAAGAVLALAASAASLLLAEARLTRRVEMLARATAGTALLTAAWYGPSPFNNTRALFYRVLFPRDPVARQDFAYLLYELALAGMVGALSTGLLHTRTGITAGDSPTSPAVSGSLGWRPDWQLVRATARHLRRSWRLPSVLLALAALAALVLFSPALQWLATAGTTLWGPAVLGFAATTSLPFPDQASWHWTNSGGYALLAGAVAWVSFVARVVLPMLIATCTARDRLNGRLEAVVLTRATRTEVLLALCLPALLPAAGAAAVLLPAALLAFRDGVPGPIVALMLASAVLALPAAAAVSAAVGLRARSAGAALPVTYGLLVLAVPVLTVLLSLSSTQPLSSLGSGAAPSPGYRYAASLLMSHLGSAVLLALVACVAAGMAARALPPTADARGGGMGRSAVACVLPLVVLAAAVSFNGAWARADHLGAAARAFAAGRFGTAARSLRRTTPEELGIGTSGMAPSVLWVKGPLGIYLPALQVARKGLLFTVKPSGAQALSVVPSRPSSTPPPTLLVSGASGIPILFRSEEACRLSALLAVTELAAGNPERALAAALDAPPWYSPARAKALTLAIRRHDLHAAYRAAWQAPMAAAPGLRVLAALVAREAVRLAPDDVGLRLEYAHAIRAAPVSPLLPTARSQFEEVLKRDARNRQALLGAVRAEEAVRLYPRDIPSRVALVERLRPDPTKRARVRRELEAICRLTAARGDRLSLQRWRKQLARVCAEMGDHAAALQALGREHPGCTRGWLLAEMGRLREAVVAYRASLRTGPLGAAPQPLLLGLAYLQLGDLTQARDAFRQGVGSPLCRAFAAWCETRRSPGAFGDHLRRLPALLPGEPGLQSLAVALDPDRQVERVLRRYPDCVPAAVLLSVASVPNADAAHARRRARRIVAVLEPVARRYPDCPAVEHTLLGAYNALGELSKVRQRRGSGASNLPPWPGMGPRSGP